MPWKIVEEVNDSDSSVRHCVINDSDNSVEKCHTTHAEAENHMKALYAAMEKKEYGANWRLFIEHEFVEPEQWIPYLPLPGELKHKKYGDVSFTLEKANRLVDGFKQGIYQSRIPIDAEHQTKLSGAVGWITDMRVNDNGSVDALTEWTDRGIKLLANKRFRYMSPEFYPLWIDPFTEEVHKDVAVGAAITTRPYIKESYLRSLIATERGFEDLTDTLPAVVKTTNGDKYMELEMKVEEQTQAFVDLQDRFTAAEAARAESEARSVKLTEALDASNARIAKMEQTAQVRRFTDLVESDKRWYGETASHLKVLRSFAETFGEESEEFAEYVQQQQALAEQLHTSELFKEYGHSRQSQKRTAAEELDVKARQLQAERTGLSYAQAYTEVLTQNPGLYNRHVKGE
ncbi:MAG: hypothetical protein DDT21_01851 [Syntrophomonadaceae bacterium]|nr:hypothetical protein [Bacillota bacterium]